MAITEELVLERPVYPHVNQANDRELEPLDLSHREVIKDHADRYNRFCCEYNFANLYLWNDICRYQVTTFNDWLVIVDGRWDYILAPLGENISTVALANLSGFLREKGLSGDIGNVPPALLGSCAGLETHYRIEESRDEAEYIYLADKLASLSTKKLRKKKNHISQFVRQYPEYRLLAMDAAVRADCLAFIRQAACSKQLDWSKRAELKVMKKAFAEFDVLALEGIGLYVEDRLVGFSVYSMLNAEVATVHFEKADHHYRGTAQLLNQAVAERLAGRCRYINREQDLGIPGLRNAKLSYEPELLYPAIFLSFK